MNYPFSSRHALERWSNPINSQTHSTSRMPAENKFSVFIYFFPILDTSGPLLVKPTNNGVKMLEITLSEIAGIHPGFARIERELDLAPTTLPDRALIPDAVLGLVNAVYPLLISGQPERYCVGQTSLYRLLAAHAAPKTRVLCHVLPTKISEKTLHQLVLIERLVAPGLAQITPQQVRDLYEHLGSVAQLWPHRYRSHADLARLVGVKPLKGAEVTK